MNFLEIFGKNKNKTKKKKKSLGISDIPDPISLDGHWTIRSKFQGRKSFGFFICNCKKTWLSAHAFKEYKQGCKSCEVETFPKYLWVNTELNKKEEIIKNLDKPHDRLRCEACKLGICLEKLSIH